MELLEEDYQFRYGVNPMIAYYSNDKYNKLKAFKTNIKINPNWKNLSIIEKHFPRMYFLNSEFENFYIVKGAYDYLIETNKFLYENQNTQ